MAKLDHKIGPQRKIDRRIEHRSRESFRLPPSEVWSLPAGRRVAVYGKYVTFVPVWQRYRKKRKDGIFQRYWKKTKRMAKKGPVKSGRYEFYGSGKTLYRAVALAHRIMPKGHVEVAAGEFVRNPYRYGVDGEWIDREVESR